MKRAQRLTWLLAGTLILALPHVPNAQGGYRLPPPAVANAIDAPPPPSIRFAPDAANALEVHRDALPDLLSPADAFCVASTEESFGLSALEAMACGTAVVGTRVGGLPEVVEDGVSGLLSPVEDLAGFAGHLASLLEDRGRSSAMGAAARERAMALFDRRRVVEQYESLYRRLIGGRLAS